MLLLISDPLASKVISRHPLTAQLNYSRVANGTKERISDLTTSRGGRGMGPRIALNVVTVVDYTYDIESNNGHEWDSWESTERYERRTPP